VGPKNPEDPKGSTNNTGGDHDKNVKHGEKGETLPKSTSKGEEKGDGMSSP